MHGLNLDSIDGPLGELAAILAPSFFVPPPASNLCVRAANAAIVFIILFANIYKIFLDIITKKRGRQIFL
ncbi:hypothetical protein GBZ26_07265 [Azospirillum formosense]|uniref:Uncharacterized protein n=1 Tax=Azospirillum formosense TaxID=861533 RepID=A0ABX2KQX7_9PROT|nr:hypothetical protein [Azospirillum formosense]MBY3756419.1 hypothetical protein [Azospirillum formosense]MBY3757029.1 hypothetical protein [Azospirillum formosense]NUB19011.1 hypothetical protein [Azospirillum formosense]